MIEVRTHNQTEVDVNMTCLQGYVQASYWTLVEIFGEPHEGCGYKTDAEWDIEFTDTETGRRVVATIYNWKSGKNYLGAEGQEVQEITHWNIGGKSSEAASLVERLVAGYDNRFLPAPNKLLK